MKSFWWWLALGLIIVFAIKYIRDKNYEGTKVLAGSKTIESPAKLKKVLSKTPIVPAPD